MACIWLCGLRPPRYWRFLYLTRIHLEGSGIGFWIRVLGLDRLILLSRSGGGGINCWEGRLGLLLSFIN